MRGCLYVEEEGAEGDGAPITVREAGAHEDAASVCVKEYDSG
jgi:hypothetical protein